MCHSRRQHLHGHDRSALASASERGSEHRRRRDRSEADRGANGTPAGRAPRRLRAGDADRERAADLLRRHTADGRLDAGELEARLERVHRATHVDELESELGDLPALPPERRARSAPAGARRATALVAVAAVLGVVTALTGLWALWWLMWPAALLLGPRSRARAW
jgi:hypothetical protein